MISILCTISSQNRSQGFCPILILEPLNNLHCTIQCLPSVRELFVNKLGFGYVFPSLLRSKITKFISVVVCDVNKLLCKRSSKLCAGKENNQIIKLLCIYVYIQISTQVSISILKNSLQSTILYVYPIHTHVKCGIINYTCAYHVNCCQRNNFYLNVQKLNKISFIITKCIYKCISLIYFHSTSNLFW